MSGSSRWIGLLRHAESEANAGRATCDASSARLTDVGRLQAERVARGLENELEWIVHSGMARARETAEIVARSQPRARLVCWPVHEFLPLAAADYAGTTAGERACASRAYWETSDPALETGAGAESFAGLMERARSAIEGLRALPAQRVLVVSHRKFLSLLVWLALRGTTGTGRRRMQRFRAFDRGLRWPNATLMPTHWEGDRVWIGGFERFDRVVV